MQIWTGSNGPCRFRILQNGRYHQPFRHCQAEWLSSQPDGFACLPRPMCDRTFTIDTRDHQRDTSSTSEMGRSQTPGTAQFWRPLFGLPSGHTVTESMTDSSIPGKIVSTQSRPLSDVSYRRYSKILHWAPRQISVSEPFDDDQRRRSMDNVPPPSCP